MTRRGGPNLETDPMAVLRAGCFLFRQLDPDTLRSHLEPDHLVVEKLYSNRPIHTAFRPQAWLDHLYVVVDGGPIIMRSTPLDRVIAMTYPAGCFGIRSIPVGFGTVSQGFPSLVEAYKTTDIIKVPMAVVKALYAENAVFKERYDLLFELREKFQYHLLNCSTYPPQAVASLLRALVYQERTLGSQPTSTGEYCFDLPVDLIARACQLNHRTVEQVLKGMTRAGYLKASKTNESSVDQVLVIDPEGLKEVYGATRDKVPWWPLK
jgi:hypothetical protein